MKNIKFLLIFTVILLSTSCADVESQGARVGDNANGIVTDIGKDFWKSPNKQQAEKDCQKNNSCQ